VDPYAWTWNPEALVVVLLAVAYIAALRRYPAPRWRTACFFTAMILLLTVSVTPLHMLAMEYLLTVHLLQNVVLAEWAPALFVLALPPSLARRAHVPMLPALLLWLGTYFAWHVPAAYDFALRNPDTVLHLEHATYFVAGCALWWPVVHGQASSGAKAIYLFAAFVLASPLGLLLALVPSPAYSFYEARPTVWGLSHILDQQIAGTTMAAEQAVILFAAFTYWFLRFLKEEERAAGLARYPDERTAQDHQHRRGDEPATHRL